MKRRDFIALAGGTALAAPLHAFAQPRPTPVVGFLNTTSSERVAPLLAIFRKALSGAGFVEGRNVTIEYRWAEGRYDRLQTLAADLVRRNSNVIAATGGTVAAKAAKAATSTIPILFVAGFDPVHEGLVASLNRPGGNATGVAVYTAELGTKRLELLQKLVPNRPISILVNPDANSTVVEKAHAQNAARELKFELRILEARTDLEIEKAFSDAVSHGTGALLVSADSFFTSRHAEIVVLAARHALPVCYPWPQYVDAGGLMSYGPNLTWAYEQIGLYTGRILNGDKPGNLPVQLPTTFEMTINLRTANALGLTISPLGLVADKIIE